MNRYLQPITYEATGFVCKHCGVYVTIREGTGRVCDCNTHAPLKPQRLSLQRVKRKP